MAAKKLIHLDDSTLALKVTRTLLEKNFPGYEIIPYQSSEKFLEDLKVQKLLPDLILSDLNMPVLNGMELLSEIKRHPHFHHIPFVLLTGEKEERLTEKCKNLGANRIIHKPFKENDFIELHQEIKSDFSIEETSRYDESFAHEAIERVSESYSLLTSFNQEKCDILFRHFHTIKGGAALTKFPHLSHFVHLAENTLVAVKKGHLYQDERTLFTLKQVLEYIESNAEFILSRKLLPLPSNDLIKAMELIIKNVESGLVLSLKINTQSSNQNNKEDLHPQGIISQNKTSVRITHQKLQELQSQLKKILVTQNKISRFSRDLIAEFSDESFPQQLSSFVEDLQLSTTSLMDFFIYLQVTKASRLESYCKELTAQTKKKLKKECELQFDCDPHLEIDQHIYDILEEAFQHIIKNCLDHGVESKDERKDLGKEDQALIKISLHPQNDKQFHIRIEDNGRGINIQKMKEKILKLGVMAPSEIDKCQDNQLADFIFIDGVSTKDEVNETSGRGVGLSAVKNAILKVEGNIHVSTKHNAGTIFDIFLPKVFKL